MKRRLNRIAAVTLAVLGAGMFALSVLAADTSEGVFLWTRPETSSFWNTAPGSTVTLPIDYPEGATAATLAVTGTAHTAIYEGITEDEYVLTLPAATDALSEDVYELTLTFDDGTVRTARLGLIAGLSSGGAGETRCLLDTANRRWSKASPHAVLPVPYGTTALTIDGAQVQDGDAGFTGAQGWYALQNLTHGAAVPVSLATETGTTNIVLNIRDRVGLFLLVH